MIAMVEDPDKGDNESQVKLNNLLFITACKRSLRRLCFYRCPLGGGGGHAWQGDMHDRRGVHGGGGVCG